MSIRPGKHQQQGITLTEIAIAVGILAAASLAAAPAFGEYLRDCRRAATLNALAHAMHTARSAAALHGTRARLCATRDGRSCSPGRDWGEAVLIIPDALPGVEPGPAQVVHLGAHRARQSVRSNRDAIEFQPLAPAATTATVTVCDDRGPLQARALIVSRTGRPRISDRDASGRLLVCP